MSRLAAPHAVVVGATDLDATAAFLARFGLKAGERRTLPADVARGLYGLDAPTEALRLAAPGTTRGHVELVATPHPARGADIFDCGPLALDLYTTDLDADHAAAVGDGLEVGPIGTLELGPLVMRQAAFTAPDGWRLVLVEANRRRPSLLDAEPDRRHSEVHSLLWTVPEVATAKVPFERAGLTEAHVFPIAHPELARILSLPSPDVELRMDLLVDEAEHPVRVELVEFPGRPGAPPADRRDRTLRAGIHALAFAADGLAAPPHSDVVEVAGEAVAVGTTDAGVRYELWPGARHG